MRITLNIRKSVIENANAYFERAKVLRKKAEGAKKAVRMHELKYEELLQKQKEYNEKLSKQEEALKQQKLEKESLKQEQKWFHKFRWFISSEGFLVIGGRDATTNEIIIKKHTAKDDIVLHTDLAGSPFVVVKTEKIKTEEIKTEENHKLGLSASGKMPFMPSERTIKEAAIFCATYSKAWKLGMSGVDVFYVKPEQVTKEARPGEYMAKGAFMIYGKKNYLRAGLDLAICNTEYGIMASPLSAANKIAKSNIIILTQGNEKTSETAKKIQKIISEHSGQGRHLDEIIKVIPPGGAKISRAINAGAKNKQGYKYGQ